MNDMAKQLAKKLVDEKSERYNLVQTCVFKPNCSHGITFDEDGKTVKAIAPNSQADDHRIVAGSEVYKVKVENKSVRRKKGKAEDFLNAIDREYTVYCGVTEKAQNVFEAGNVKRINCVEIHVRLLMSRLFNFNVQEETFEADLFVEFMWLAPWDLPEWRNYMGNLAKNDVYKDFCDFLDVEDWKGLDLKPFTKPKDREEEVYYSERVVQSFDRQWEDQAPNAKIFLPKWKPRVIFQNMRSKNYDDMNFGGSSYSMVNLGKQWYTVWRRNFNSAVFCSDCRFENFPYDIQELAIPVMCTHPKTRVKLVNHICYRSSCIILEKKILLPEWEYLGMRCSLGEDSSGRFSTFTFEAVLRRKSDYFIKSGKHFFTFLTVVSFFVFGIPAEHGTIGDRLEYGITCLLTTLMFDWLISEKTPNLPYNTYLDNYIYFGFAIQLLIMLSNGLMIFVRLRDDDGKIDNNACQTYDYICFTLIFAVYLIYQIYTGYYRLPRIMKEEHKKLDGMTFSKFEKVTGKYLELVTRRMVSKSLDPEQGAG